MKQLNLPIQIIRVDALKNKGVQDDCTIAWNLFVALYYKSGYTRLRQLDSTWDDDISELLSQATYLRYERSDSCRKVA